MVPATLVSVEEYLSTSFQDGDREYIDGRIVERNVGEVDHGDLQTAMAVYLSTRFRKYHNELGRYHSLTVVALKQHPIPSRDRVPPGRGAVGRDPPIRGRICEIVY